MNRNVDKFDTTIGELVAALSDVAFEVCTDKVEAYFLVALALKSLLGKAQGSRISVSERIFYSCGIPLFQ